MPTRLRHRGVHVLLALGLWLLAWPAHAGDGAIVWKTLRMPDADLTYPAGYEAMALRVARTWADARATLGQVLHPRPGRLQITLDDFSDSANGFATVMPFDHVHLQAYPPAPGSELGDHGDWLRALVFHEYTHILHLGTTSAVPALVNAVVGPALLPNAQLPRFLTEGLATWSETRHTGGDRAVAGHGGRVDSPVYLAQLRAATVAGTWPELSELTGTPLTWPRGSGWYLYGSLLVDDLAQHHGHDSVRAFVDAMGARLVPFGVQGIARQAFDVSLGRAWLDARRRLQAQVRADVLARVGVDLGEEPSQSTALAQAVAQGDGMPLTQDAEFRGRLRAWPDGQSVVVAHGPRDGQFRRVERVWPDGRTDVVHTCALDCDEPFVAGGWLLFTETRRHNRLYLFRDLLAVALDEHGHARGPTWQLTHGARLRSPSLSPDGREILAVRVHAGRTSIDALNLPDALTAAQAERAGPTWQTLVPAPPWGQTVDSPVRLPDGTLAWTLSRGARRVIQTDRPHPWLHDTGAKWVGDVAVQPDGTLTAVVEDGGFREAAWWRADGTWLATRTLTGIASAARLTGTQAGLVTVRTGARGLDVFLAPDRARALVPAAVPEVADLPYQPTPLDTYDEGTYLPLHTAWPRYWRPLVAATGDRLTTVPGGLWLGATTAGTDALGYWRWAATAQIRDDGTDPIGAFSLAITRWEPTWSLDLGYQQGFTYLRRGFSWYTTPTDRWGFVPRVSWQYARLRDVWQFDLGWRWVRSSLRDDRYALRYPYDPAGPTPQEPWTGWDAFIDAGVAYSWSASSPEAITTERLHTAAARVSWSDRWTGGGRERVVLSAATTHRWPLGGRWPLGQRVVLDVAANLGVIPVPNDPSPGLGVRGIQPMPVSLLAGSGTTGVTIRGLPVDPVLLAGNGLAWGTLQLHVPLLDIGRGLDTLPLWFGRVRALPFVDAATAFLPPLGASGMTGTAVSAGAELWLDWELGYAIDGTLRLGAGHAFFPGSADLSGHTGGWLLLGL